MTDSQKWLLLVIVAGFCWLLYLLAPVFTPFLIAALFAYLGDPLVDRIEKWKFSRTFGVVIVFLFMFILFLLAILLLVPLVEKQVSYLVTKLPDYVNWMQNTAIPWLASKIGLADVQVDLASLNQMAAKYWKEAGGFAAQLFKYISSSGLALVGLFASLVLIPVVTFYMLRDWDILVARIHSLIPKRMEHTIVTLASESDVVLGAFLRGQVLVMVALGFIYSIGLMIIGLKLGLLIGMLAGLVSFVPYLGFIIGILAASIAVLVQTHDAVQLIPVAMVFGVGQLLESFLLTPMLVGDRIGLHPVVVIFAIMAGGQLFGFFGILLALPVAAVLAVLVRHAHDKYLSSHLYDQANR